jgi:release factor glutamine methyltransferase
MATVGQSLREAAARLAGDDPRREAEALMAAALGKDRAWLYAHADEALDDASWQRFLGLVELRRQGQPVAYLVGVREFWSLPLAVSVDTLVPRPETELLVELALQRLPADAALDILDLGTGSGAIALALASERPRARVTAVDLHPRTLAMAGKNAGRLGLGRLRLLRSDWYSALAGERYFLVASNPPYIAENDPHLLQGDLRHEPRMALASGADGLEALRCIVGGAPRHLLPGGWLLVEHGWEQGAAVRGLFLSAGFVEVETARDLEDRERVTLGKCPQGQAP